MFEYNYFENLTLEELNALGEIGWEVKEIEIPKILDKEGFNVFLVKGFQEKTLIENTETGAKFWVDETFSYGETMVIIFLTIFTFAVIGKIIYNFIFKNA